jgi:hypothetical protein
MRASGMDGSASFVPFADPGAPTPCTSYGWYAQTGVAERLKGGDRLVPDI